MNRTVWQHSACRIFAAINVFIPVTAFAQGIEQADKVISLKVLPWAALVGTAWCGVGLVRGFAGLSDGRPDAKDQIKHSAIGALGCTGAAGLLQLLTTWAR